VRSTEISKQPYSPRIRLGQCKTHRLSRGKRRQSDRAHPENGDKVIVHIVNAQDRATLITLKVAGKLSGIKMASKCITSADQNAAAMPDLESAAGGFSDTLPAQSMVTYRIEAPKLPQ
jgi:hypothetical protein